MKRTILAMAIMGFCGAWAHAGTEVNETRPAAMDGHVEIENVSGSIEVIGWDRAEVKVEGTLGDDVERLDFDVHNGRTDIEVVVPRHHGRRHREIEAHLTIHVPARSTLEVDTVSASIQVDGVKGESIAAEVVSGSIRIKDCIGRVEAETVSGSIRVSGRPTRVELSTVSGRIEASGVQEAVDAEAVSGSIHIEAGALERCEASAVSGSVDFKGTLRPGGRLDIEVFSGSVDLDLTSDVFGDYDISTSSGGIRCDFGPEPTKPNRYSQGKELRFRHTDSEGKGASRVSVGTFSGSIRIRRN